MALRPITPDSVQRFCCLVIAPAGLGKTSLLRTIHGQEFENGAWVQKEEPTQRVCVLSAESGLLCVQDLVTAGAIEGFEIGSLQEFREAQAACMQPDFMQRYQWIFIDSLTEISGRSVEFMKQKYQSSSDTYKLWGEYNDAMTQIIKAFRDMTAYNVVFTCLESVETDENKRRFLAPAIAGREIKQRLTSYFDEVFHMEMVYTDQGQAWRVFRTDQPLGLAKDRSGRLSAVENPNLLAIQRKILGARPQGVPDGSTQQ